MNAIALSDLRLLAPLITVALGAVALLLIEVFQRSRASRDYLSWIGALFLGVAAVDTVYLLSSSQATAVMSGMLVVDGFGLTSQLILLLGGAMACLMSPAYLASHKMARGEYYALVLFSVVGMMTMVAAVDLFTIFLGLEMMSIPIYCLVGFFRHSGRSAEAALKYFLLGAFASALLLYGIALIYGLTGTTDLESIARVLENNPAGFLATGTHPVSGAAIRELATLPGLALLLILVAFGFKNALVPFHMWTPDVYTGAPTTVTAWMATGVKAASLLALVRIFCVGFYAEPARLSGTGWIMVLFWMALLSMILGNVAAMAQRNVKRMLAWSSVAHAGYLLVGFLAAAYNPSLLMNLEAVLFYLLSYTLTTGGAFAVLAWLGKRGEEAVTFDDLSGLSARHPGAALAMTIFMLSSAGIPPTAGFVAKFYVFKAAIQTGEAAFVGLSIAGILFSVAGVYYYLRVIVSMYMKDARREVVALAGPEIRLVVLLAALGVAAFGIFPNLGLELMRHGVQTLRGLPVAAATAPPAAP
jgi:NADH-quinone oxidoreductase subunit N